MNILCPNCQKMIQVQEQYAGQVMNCPLCGGALTVPALPRAPGLPAGDSSVSSPRQGSPPEDPSGSVAPPTPEHSGAGVYGLAPPPEPRPSSRRPEPSPSAPWQGATPTGPAREPLPEQPVPPTAPAGYRHPVTLRISPRIVRWIAPAALAVVFLLLFFPWVGMYPGGYNVYSQNAWQAAVGAHDADPVFWEKVVTDYKEPERPGVSVLTIFFLLFFLAALVLAFAAVGPPAMQSRVPPRVARLWPWRTALARAAATLALFFLVLQLFTGFALESAVKRDIDKRFEAEGPRPKMTEEDKMIVTLKESMALGEFQLHRTCWLRLAVLLHFVALAGVGLTLWLDWRGNNRPLPRIDFLY